MSEAEQQYPQESGADIASKFEQPIEVQDPLRAAAQLGLELGKHDNQGVSLEIKRHQFPEKIRALVKSLVNIEDSPAADFTSLRVYHSDSLESKRGAKKVERHLDGIEELCNEIYYGTKEASPKKRGAIVKDLWQQIENTPKIISKASGMSYEEMMQVRNDTGDAIYFEVFTDFAYIHDGLGKEMGFEKKTRSKLNITSGMQVVTAVFSSAAAITHFVNDNAFAGTLFLLASIGFGIDAVELKKKKETSEFKKLEDELEKSERER